MLIAALIALVAVVSAGTLVAVNRHPEDYRDWTGDDLA